MDAYETIMLWLSLYPHNFGDELLREIIEDESKQANRALPPVSGG
jgi:hypothetical protein